MSEGWKIGRVDALFAKLDRPITEARYILMAGQIVVATLVAARRERNLVAEKARIKAGEKRPTSGPTNPPRRARMTPTRAGR